MGKRGRQSTADMATSPAAFPIRMLAPPHDLGADEQRLFREVVANCAGDHLTANDMPLLVSYVQSTLLARHTAKGMFKNPDLVQTWERAVRTQAMLATRLRLSPQSRVHPGTAGRRAVNHTSASAYDTKPWENLDA